MTCPWCAGFAPRASSRPAVRRRGREVASIVFRAALENGEHAREVRLHYREADQNRAFGDYRPSRAAGAGNTSSASTRAISTTRTS